MKPAEEAEELSDDAVDILPIESVKSCVLIPELMASIHAFFTGQFPEVAAMVYRVVKGFTTTSTQQSE